MHWVRQVVYSTFSFFGAKVDLRIRRNGICGASKLPSMSAPDGRLDSFLFAWYMIGESFRV